MLREWTIVEDCFSPAECDALLGCALKRPRALGTVGTIAKPEVDTTRRRAEVAFIRHRDPNPVFRTAFSRIEDHVEDANNACFRVAYDRRLPKLQFTVYQAREGQQDFYRNLRPCYTRYRGGPRP